MKILMVLTSHDELGNTGEKTGFWLEEFASPYYAFVDSGVELTLASPKGGQPPLDPKSDLPDFQTDSTQRFKDDELANERLAKTQVLGELNFSEFDGVFYPGGHGPLWDLANDSDSIQLIETYLQNDKPVAAVCHAPGVLLKAKASNGEPLVKGMKVTGFSNSEEAAVELTDVVPFLIEDEVDKLGGDYSKTDDWASHVVVDGLLITGQNPASSESTAKALLDALA